MKKIYPLLLDSITPESTASNGFLKDNSLDDLIETYMGNLLGDNVFSFFQGNLPVTVQIKEQKTPITVSPDDETALPRYGCWGKERMLYILSADKDSSIWIGFSKTLSATDIYERCQEGTILQAMNEIAPEEGETFYIRPGVPFCIGSGVRYVDLSQNSPVELNIEDLDQLVEALDFIHLDSCNPEYVAPESCLFRMERVAITKPQTIAPDQTESFMAIVNLDNSTSLRTKDIRGLSDNSEENFINLTGNAIALIPHDISELIISPSQEGENPASSFLRIYMCNVPEPPKEEDEDKDEHDHHCGCDAHHHHSHHDDCDCGHNHYN
ncbi:MAG: hypothetical protein J6X91_04825 [Bacteroidales bacterium]|nr:hypothetical protein [Bacteroidales bacterium]